MKYAILRLDILKLIKYSTKDELQDMISDFERDNVPIQVYKNHGAIWSVMEVCT